LAALPVVSSTNQGIASWVMRLPIAEIALAVNRAITGIREVGAGEVVEISISLTTLFLHPSGFPGAEFRAKPKKADTWQTGT
jgi:hypothetical protein